MMINVLIADDEYLARETIKLLLKDQPDIAKVIEAEDGKKALKLCNLHQPELIFLDIQMPGYTGIQLMEKLPDNTIVIFATAYDQYAIKAFDLNAIDYLLKPFDDERFYEALDKARSQINAKKLTNFKEIGMLIQQMNEQQDKKYKTRLIVKEPGRIKLIDVAQINYIAGAGNYADVYLFDEKHILHRETLTSLETQLDPKEFVRIHRSSIVRRSSVAELRANENGDYTVILKSGHELTLSRRNKDKLEELISE
ncbi:LytR/AlgR family response regulator transcription factor [Colwelliaceae bacterium 6471]